MVSSGAYLSFDQGRTEAKGVTRAGELLQGGLPVRQREQMAALVLAMKEQRGGERAGRASEVLRGLGQT